jgi:tetratricopeptide (TPR) repeat protein
LSAPEDVCGASERIAGGEEGFLARIERGEAFARIGAVEAALGDFEMVIGACPTSVRALLGAASALFTMKRYVDACQRYLEALEIDEQNPIALAGFKTLVTAFRNLRLPPGRLDVTQFKLKHCRCAESRVVRALFEKGGGAAGVEGSLADPEFREVLMELMDDGLVL